jgi:hypothetical protein
MKKNVNLWIFFCSIFLFSIKWYYPFSNFDESIDVRVIFESISDGYYYFPLLKALSSFDLNYSFDPSIENLGTVAIPTGAFFLHFIFYLLIGSWSFIILEFFFILLFLVIFYKIFRLLSCEKIQSLTLSVALFTIPNFLQILNLDKLNYFSVISSEFFSLRFPRPMVTNIFFFLFILFLIKFDQKKIFLKKNFILLGILSGLSFTSLVHLFFVEQVSLLFFLFYKFKSQTIKKLKQNISCVVAYIVSFILVSSPFLINIYFTEPDFLERLGLVNLNYEKKIILVKYLFVKLFKPEFLIIFIITISLIILLNSKNFFKELRKLNVIFIMFYASIISPFAFILISTKFFSHFYLFNNQIVILAFLLLFSSVCIIINTYLKNFFFDKFANSLFIFLLTICLVTNFFQTYKNYNKIHLSEENASERKEFNKVVNIINEMDLLDKNNNLSLLTFDNRFLVWFILNEIKYLNIVNGVLVPRKHEMIENDLINTFKYLRLSVKNFEKFLENKKLSTWRYRNENVKNLFWMLYQANSLTTFNDSKNFNKEILEFINNSSPLLSQQLAIPNDELQRLIKKFDFEKVSNLSDPKIIIINKKNSILIKSSIDLDDFCKKFEGKFYDFYYNLNLESNCNS